MEDLTLGELIIAKRANVERLARWLGLEPDSKQSQTHLAALVCGRIQNPSPGASRSPKGDNGR
jgi:hypothetical protein